MITDADGYLAARFAALRDDSDDADWNDVLRRLKPRSRRRVRALVVVLAVIVVGVPTALAFGAVRDFFFGSPAPPLIRNQFAGQNTMRKMMERWQRAHHVKLTLMPEVNGRQAHGVMAVDTSDGPLLLWAAPAAKGRQCWFVEFARDQIGHKRATGSGGCDMTQPPPSKMNWGYGWSAAHPTLKVLNGRLYVHAVSIDVTAADAVTGRTKVYRLPVTHGYFLAAFPRSVRTPTKVVARDRRGAVVAKFTQPR